MEMGMKEVMDLRKRVMHMIMSQKRGTEVKIAVKVIKPRD
jgi:hypothetical protein